MSTREDKQQNNQRQQASSFQTQGPFSGKKTHNEKAQKASNSLNETK